MIDSVSSASSDSQPRWGTARQIEDMLSGAECEVLEYIARLPLISVALLRFVIGFADAADIYHRLQRLRSHHLVGLVQPGLEPGHNARLLYLTDLGLAVLALFWEVEPAEMVRDLRLDTHDLLARLADLPYLLASYQMLAGLADAGSVWPTLLAWWRPWRRRFYRQTAKAPIRVRVPASVVLAWTDEGAQFLLVPDLLTHPGYPYRPMLNNLLALRHRNHGGLPALLIATWRPNTWRTILQETARSQQDRPLFAGVATWSSLHDDVEQFVARCHMFPAAELPTWSYEEMTLCKRRHDTQPIPHFVATDWETP